MPKANRSMSRRNDKSKLCSDGTVLAYNKQDELEQQETLENEAEAVKRMISDMVSVDEVVDTAFYIICFNVFCSTEEGEYIPAEMGIVKYSIRRGIEGHYHCFIDPGRIPLGYSSTSKLHSKDTHKIPILGFKEADNNYNKIYKQILDIVNPNQNAVAPVFCVEECLQQNRGCLQWLSQRIDYFDMESIHFYDVTFLLMELLAYVKRPVHSKAVALDCLSNRVYDYTPNIRCIYHEVLDNGYCALGLAHSVCFILSDTVCKLYNVQCSTNHLPPKARVDDAVQREIDQLLPLHGLSTSPKLTEQCTSTVSRNVPPKTSKSLIVKDDSRPWMKEFNQPHSDTALFNEDDFPPLNGGKPSKCGEPKKEFNKPQADIALSKDDFPPLNRKTGETR